MHNSLDGNQGGHRANHTLRDALTAQLTLLDGFFPLLGWIVGSRRNGRFGVLAAHGDWQRSNLATISDVMHGQWTAYSDHPGFQYRAMDEAEQTQVAGLFATTGSVPDCIIRRPLRNLEGHTQAWLIGVANQKSIGNIVQPGFQADYVTQAVVGITLCMALHADLESVQRQLTELQLNAFIEPLTRVLNRAGWVNRVQHLEDIVARSDEDVAIVMLDLDLLKLVNDLEGHSAGDELLQLTAQTIQSVVRRSDVVGRLGGDEFGVAVRGVNRQFAQSMVQRLRTALDDVGVKVSIGLAMKSESSSLKDALGLADSRMYEEKRAKPMPAGAMAWQRGAVNQNPDSCL